MKTKDTFLMYGELLGEAVGDNKLDNMAAELRRSVEVEISTFVISLLNSTVKAFLSRYENPQYEGFREVMRDIRTRYRVMDGVEKEDLFNKVEGVFKDIFLRSFSAMGPETAELVAGRYAQQMIEIIKREERNPNAAINDLYLGDRKMHPKDCLPYDAAMPKNDQNNEVENQIPIPGFRNVY